MNLNRKPKITHAGSPLQLPWLKYPPWFLTRNHLEDNAEDDGIVRRCWDTYATINALVRNYSYSQEIKMSQSFKVLIIMARLILNFIYRDFDSMFTMLNKRNILYICKIFSWPHSQISNAEWV